MASSPCSAFHTVLFPFMSKGHTIPLLHLGRLLIRHGVSITVFTTPLNAPFIRQSLTGTDASILELPFPIIEEIPPGVESTDKLPSISMFPPFALGTKFMKPDFDKELRNLPNVTCIISDGFLGWTQDSANGLGVPRYYFYGMSNHASTMCRVVFQSVPFANVISNDDPFILPEFPWIKLTKNDFDPTFLEPDPDCPHLKFRLEQIQANMQSKGYIVNSFYELESKFVDWLNAQQPESKSWCVGPLCLAEPPKAQPKEKPMWMEWLDEKLTKGGSVLYVAFGTQAEISEEQLEEIAMGLKESEMSFLWAVRSIGLEKLNWLRERFGDKGLLVSEWVDQVEILGHKSVNGFMSHCGWNSVIESICASVPILAWPMMAEQHLNARMVVDELGIGVRVLARNGSVRGFVGRECIEKMVKELMEGEKGKEMRKNVQKMGKLAPKAMEEGGSSWCSLDLLLQDMCNNN